MFEKLKALEDKFNEINEKLIGSLCLLVFAELFNYRRKCLVFFHKARIQ